MPPSRAPFLIGKTGSFEISTLAKVDKALHDLRLRLTQNITRRQRGRLWHDVDQLLDARAAMTRVKVAAR